jgi:tetratricopeptide (TPR) repeat protein
MAHLLVDWLELESLARRLAEPTAKPGSVPEVEWRTIAQALADLLVAHDWRGVLRLREMFTALFARDTFWGLAVLKRLDDEAIAAARRIDDKLVLAHLLGARGHNLHRQGFHLEAVRFFNESAALYNEIGGSFYSLKSYYMTALCYRALGERKRTHQVLAEVLEEVSVDDPWRGNPLQVMAWLARDERRFIEAEHFLQEALYLHERTEDPDVLVAGTLADLGEIFGLQGRFTEAKTYFEQSLDILLKHEGQYDRQEARTRLKFAELLIRAGEYEPCLQLLDKADDKVRAYGHYYDLMWHIESAKALVYLRQGRFGNAVRKLRVAWNYRKTLGLPNILLVRPIIRQWLGVNLLRRQIRL